VSESNTAMPEVQATMDVAIPPPPPIEPAPPPPAPPVALDFQGRRVRPLLGPSLWIFGMLLWAHVVFGTFVIGKNMPESYALLAVLVVVLTAWALSVRERQDTARFVFRHVAPVLVALAFWAAAMFFALLIAAVLGGGPGIGYLLGLLAIIALFVGRRFAGPPRKPATLPRKVLYGFLWLLGAMTTFVAVVMHADM